MKIDQDKLARQELAFNRWRDGLHINSILRHATGIIVGTTGFGKTYILILAIRYMNKHHPDRNAIVVVPTTKLLEDWIGYWAEVLDPVTNKSSKKWIAGHLEIHNLKSTKVFVVNSYVKFERWECDLLGLDECHRYANQDAQYFSQVLKLTQFKYLMGLSATLSKKQEEFFAKLNIPIVDRITREEAEKHGWVAPSTVYNLGIELTEEDKKFNEEINEKFKFYFSRFQHEFDIVKACNGKKNVPVSITLRNGKYLGKKTPKEWIEEYARVNKYNGDPKHPYSPDNIARNAAQCMNIIHKRRDKWQNFPSKLQMAVKLIHKFPVKTICFSQTSAFADKLTALLPNIAMSYHSNLGPAGYKGDEVIEIGNQEEKEELKRLGYEILGKTKRQKLAISKFSDLNGPIRVASTVKALDEGADFPFVQLAIQLAYDSTTRQDTQRNGRAGRKDYSNLNKRATIVNFYMKGTQEEKWVREKQKEGVAVNWIDSIEDISLNGVLNIGGTKDEITIQESDIISGTSSDNSTESSS